MKIKNLNLSMAALTASLAIMACGNGSGHNGEMTADLVSGSEEMPEAVVREINAERSSVQWKATMVGFYSHEGTVGVSGGNLELRGGMVTGGSVRIDLSTIMPIDENFNPKEGKTKEKLVGHLSSPEFFDVADYPSASFVIKENEHGTISGDLTIRGVTEPALVKNIKFDESTSTWTGKMTFNRKHFGVSWDSPMKEMVLSDDVELNINLVL